MDERKSKGEQLDAILAKAQGRQIPEAFSFAFGLPPILGLSVTGGYQFMLEDRSGGDIQQLNKVADTLVDTMAAAGAGQHHQHFQR